MQTKNVLGVGGFLAASFGGRLQNLGVSTAQIISKVRNASNLNSPNLEVVFK
jgi:hypothetical protein